MNTFTNLLGAFSTMIAIGLLTALSITLPILIMQRYHTRQHRKHRGNR